MPDSVVYVWFDALINYATAVGYGTDEARLAQWWPADLHVIGKDITRFHTVVWPAMLWSAGLEAPRQVFGHGWLHYGGQRMSKSLGTSVDPVEAAAEVRPGRHPPVPDQGDLLRQRRRLHVGALRRALQRRPRQQPRQPGEPRRVDGRQVPRRPACAGRRRRPAGRRRRGRVRALPHGHGRASRCTTAWPRRSRSWTPPTSSSPTTPRGSWPRTRPTPHGSTPCCSRPPKPCAWPRCCCCR